MFLCKILSCFLSFKHPNKRVLFIHRFTGQFGKYRQLEMEQVIKDSLRPIMHPYMMCSITLFPIWHAVVPVSSMAVMSSYIWCVPSLC